MQALKASGLDGFHVLFYKKYWANLGESVTRAVTSFFQARRMPVEVNTLLLFVFLNHKALHHLLITGL